MFLWVQLVLSTLKEVHSAQDLELAVDDLPDGLDEAYIPLVVDLKRVIFAHVKPGIVEYSIAFARTHLEEASTKPQSFSRSLLSLDGR